MDNRIGQELTNESEVPNVYAALDFLKKNGYEREAERIFGMMRVEWAASSLVIATLDSDQKRLLRLLKERVKESRGALPTPGFLPPDERMRDSRSYKANMAQETGDRMTTKEVDIGNWNLVPDPDRADDPSSWS